MIFKSKKRKIFPINIGSFLSFSLEKELDTVLMPRKASPLRGISTVILIKSHGLL